jgi:hypothetical protein
MVILLSSIFDLRQPKNRRSGGGNSAPGDPGRFTLVQDQG